MCLSNDLHVLLPLNLFLKYNTLLQLYSVIFFSNDVRHLEIFHHWLALLCRSAVAYFINITTTFFCFPKHLVHVKQSAVERPVLSLFIAKLHIKTRPSMQITAQNGGGIWGLLQSIVILHKTSA